MSTTLIISSRRNSTRELAHRLNDELTARIPGATIHRGVERISVPGLGLKDAIAQEAARCEALLVLIDNDWLGDGQWLSKPADFNALALTTAINNSRLIIPVLIDGAQLPAAGALPPVAQSLAKQQVIDMNAGFSQGIDKIVSRVQGKPAQSQQKPATSSAPSARVSNPAPVVQPAKPAVVPQKSERQPVPTKSMNTAQQVITPQTNAPNIAAQASQKVDMVVAQTTSQTDLYMIPHVKAQTRTIVPTNSLVVVIARDIKSEWLNVGYVSTVGEVLPGWVPVAIVTNFSLKGRSVQLLDVKISDFGSNTMEDIADLIKLEKVALRQPAFIMTVLWCAAIAVGALFGATFGVIGAIVIFIASLVVYSAQTHGIHQEIQKLESIRKSKRSPGQAAKESAQQAAKQAAAAAGLAAIVGAALMSSRSNKK